MSSGGRYDARLRGGRNGLGGAALALLAVVAFGVIAGTAWASKSVNIVSQGEPPAKVPANTHYFTTIQAAVDASTAGDWVLIEPGVYTEEVWVGPAQKGIHIRGMNRNTVILDGQNKPKPEGSNGIEIYEANRVSVENLTVRNFDRASLNGPGGNEIWFNGGADSKKIGLHNWSAAI